MLEDFTMEKKPSSRSVQTPSKGYGIDAKKSQDGSNNKQFPRTRRRETPSNGVAKFEQGRKPIPQKSKTMDKRPRARGQYYHGGKEDSQVEESYEVELGSVFTPGSKKQNLNHLLNFHYAPRGENVNSLSGPRPQHQYGSRWLMSTHKHKYNKEHFLQANCQFVVRSDGDYTPYSSDPDILVNWDLVEQIRVTSFESVTCPICLSTPVAGKMTRCGHVYCFPCILHYLALSDKSWRKCPICYEAVHKKDLKSVLVQTRNAYTVGQPITFQLMKREKGSLISSPVLQFDVRHGQRSHLLSVSEKVLDTNFSKLLGANSAEVLEIIDKEKIELDVQLSENEGCPELCFIEQALELVNERRQDLLNRNTNKSVTLKKSITSLEDSSSKDKIVHSDKEIVANSPRLEAPYLQTVTYKTAFDDRILDSTTTEVEEDTITPPANVTDRPRYESMSSEGEDGSFSATTITAEDLDISLQSQLPTKYFYFYQAMDGQQIYLHAINARMLEMTHTSLENSPHVVSGIIVEKEAGSMTEELRHRLRYLQHLPVTCQFEVAEIKLTKPTVDEHTLVVFKAIPHIPSSMTEAGVIENQLEMRQRRRQKRAREERRREKKIAEVENRQYGIHPTPKLRIESLHHFPQCGGVLDNEPLPRVASEESSRASSPISIPRSESPDTTAMAALSVKSSIEVADNSGPSFAQMLREGKTYVPRGGGWPSMGTGSVWGKPLSATSSSQTIASNSSDGEASALHYNNSFSEAIALALEQASAQKVEPGPSNGNKKKKKQKVVLFSTGMACSTKKA